MNLGNVTKLEYNKVNLLTVLAQYWDTIRISSNPSQVSRHQNPTVPTRRVPRYLVMTPLFAYNVIDTACAEVAPLIHPTDQMFAVAPRLTKERSGRRGAQSRNLRLFPTANFPRWSRSIGQQDPALCPHFSLMTNVELPTVRRPSQRPPPACLAGEQV